MISAWSLSSLYLQFMHGYASPIASVVFYLCIIFCFYCFDFLSYLLLWFQFNFIYWYKNYKYDDNYDQNEIIETNMIINLNYRDQPKYFTHLYLTYSLFFLSFFDQHSYLTYPQIALSK